MDDIEKIDVLTRDAFLAIFEELIVEQKNFIMMTAVLYYTKQKMPDNNYILGNIEHVLSLMQLDLQELDAHNMQ
jgi:hypothetical protein